MTEESACDIATLEQENRQLRARIKRLEAALHECKDEIDGYIRQEYPADHPYQERCRQRDFAANPARVALSEHGGEK